MRRGGGGGRIPGRRGARRILLAAVCAGAVAWVALPRLLAPGDRTAPPWGSGGPAGAGVVSVPGSSGDGEAGVSTVRGDGTPPREPNTWFVVERAFPDDRIPLDRWRAARARAADMRRSPARDVSWTARGPSNIGGRVTSLAVDPTDDRVVFAGAAEGGVLRSVDGGATWEAVFDDQEVLAIGALAIDPRDPDTVLAGTGEANPGGGSMAYGGAGLFRSTDGGASWESLGLEQTGSIARVVIDAADPQRLFVAAMGQLWEDDAGRGVFRSADGGATWEQVLFVDEGTGCIDLVQRPDDPDVLFAATWERRRRAEAFDYGGPGSGVYRSDDGGDTWQRVGGGLPEASEDGGRIGLALCDAQPDVMAAIYAAADGTFDGIYRSTDGGATWARTDDADLASVYSSYGWWFGNVRIHPDDPERILVLGLTLWSSDDGGRSYVRSDDGMHVDHHALVFGPAPERVIYEGNDGGVYRSDDDAATWTELVDLPITQVYRLALDPSDARVLYVGTQDNGTCRTVTGALDDWERIAGGDGFAAVVHPDDPARVWTLRQYGHLKYSNDGGESWTEALKGIDPEDRVNWDAPHVMDPSDPGRRYYGTQRVYRSVGNLGWEAISPDLTGGTTQGQAGQVDGTLTTIGVSPVDGDVLWTGSDDGHVFVTDDGGGRWTDVSGDLPLRWVTAVRPDPRDAETAYATLSGFRWAESEAHVYRTDDLGRSWAPLGADLPDAPVNDLLVDPEQPGRLFAASDVGVFESVDGGAHWSALGRGLPIVVVNALALDAPRRILVAGTYGRSTFSCPVPVDGGDAPPPDDGSAGPRNSTVPAAGCACSGGPRASGPWWLLTIGLLARRGGRRGARRPQPFSSE